ncbi:MAG: TonB-dependent receptor plug domain-containing protein, partial [Flavisolibacter sp.]
MKSMVTQKLQKASTSLRLPWEKMMFTASFLLLFTFFVQAQNVLVKGRVTNENGQGVSGASITVKGSNTGTSADNDGNFEISAPANGTLVISAINFTLQEVQVNNRGTINVSLVSFEKTESEIIVVGYGTQRKEAITGSVASINGDKMREVPAPNISQALQGRLAGVEMTQTSTRPGATMQIRVRGTRSLSADNNPLIVLDGIPFMGSIADINPNDVRSIEILKDASATAIYGSRGANGVILITTDKGSRNRKPRINYNAYHGAQKIFAKYPMMNGPEFVALRAAAAQYTNGQDESDDINTDWQDLFYKTG